MIGFISVTSRCPMPELHCKARKWKGKRMKKEIQKTQKKKKILAAFTKLDEQLHYPLDLYTVGVGLITNYAGWS